MCDLCEPHPQSDAWDRTPVSSNRVTDPDSPTASWWREPESPTPGRSPGSNRPVNAGWELFKAFIVVFLIGFPVAYLIAAQAQSALKSMGIISSAYPQGTGQAQVQSATARDPAVQAEIPAVSNAQDAAPMDLPSFVAVDDTQDLVVVTWNVGMDDADPAVIADRIGRFQEVDLWALQEVTIPSYAAPMEAAAEQGEDADFSHVLGKSGNDLRLLSIYNNSRFELVGSMELSAINTTGNARAPLVLHLRDRDSGSEFLFVNNHLYRSRDDERLRQAHLLNEWAAGQELPVITAGDFNYDWDVASGPTRHDAGFDAMTASGVWEWVQPETITTTQCSGWPCRYNSVLDFVFTAGAAREWEARSAIIVEPGDFPDDDTTSDHRPVLARLVPIPTGSASTALEVAIAPQSPLMRQETIVVESGLTARSGPTPVAADTDSLPTVVIEDVLYDGQVYRVESDEYAVIANLGNAPVDLTGWTLDAGGGNQRFVFPSYSLAPGARIRVYTDEIHPESGGFSFGLTKAIWNNKGECGKLLDSTQRVVNRFCY